MTINQHGRQFSPEDIAERFDYHPPGAMARRMHEEVRYRFKELARILNDLVPDGREKAMAMTDLENGLMHANAAIARNPALHADVEKLVEEGMARSADEDADD